MGEISINRDIEKETKTLVISVSSPFYPIKHNIKISHEQVVEDFKPKQIKYEFICCIRFASDLVLIIYSL